MSDHHLPHPHGRHGAGHTHGVMEGWIVAPYDLLVARLTMRGMYRRIARAVAADLPTGAVVADIGTGPGRFPVVLRRLRADLQVNAVDPSADMLARARRSGSDASIHWIEAGAEALPLPDGSQDAVVSSLSSHHWADVDRAVAEQVRVLRPGGRLWVFDMAARLDPGLADALSRSGVEVREREVDLGWFGRWRFRHLHADKPLG